MAKVMLVEDDNNLREIYEARLAAEGYEIVSAHDGEEALALAVKEQPDLIISDIMMPKISGFDMLDILRSTPETKDTKVIMMTALSQIEDKERADKLGADRYLVKSQVTLEDVVRVAKELLGQTESQANSIASAAAGTTPDPASATTTDSTMTMATPPSDDADDNATPTPATEEPVSDTPVVTDETAVAAEPTPEVAEPEPAAPVAETPEPAEAPAPSVPEPVSSPAPEPAAEPVDVPDTGSTDDPDEPVTAAPATVPVDTQAPAANVEDQIRDFISTAEQVKNNANTPAPTPAAVPTQIPVTSADEPAEPAQPQLATPSGQKKVITPINDLSSPGPDLDALLAKEESKPADTTTPVPSVNTVISPDGTLSYATPPPTDAAPTGSVPEEKASDIAQPPHQPGQKIDPDNIAL
ncbi:response regulator [Candidatus Saccharibacteria bacterium]|nr:response regulator [Candidatus Saccharibacteria bacterium]